MNTDTDRRAAYTAGLRALADALAANPDLPLPSEGSLWPLSIPFHSGGMNDEDRAAALASAARILIPGVRTKKVDDNYYRVTGHLHGLEIQVWAMREQLCTRVVKGVREVTREVPDPEALAAVPTTTVTETVEDVEWVCAPLLADERPEPVSA
jgi:hypothetical protein